MENLVKILMQNELDLTEKRLFKVHSNFHFECIKLKHKSIEKISFAVTSFTKVGFFLHS